MNKIVQFILGAGAITLLAGCDKSADLERPALEVAELKELKGTSFAEAPTTSTTTAPQPTTADAGAPVKPATVADIPADIAKIPSATPVPRTPAPIGEVAGGNPAPQPNSPPADPSSYQTVSFNTLSGFKYIEPVPKEGAKPEEVEAQRKKDQIPADVVALNGKKVALEGWMVPMQVDDDGGVKSFVLVKTQPQCCFGDTQAMNEWVDVTMPPNLKAEFNVDRPIMVYGQIEVGEKMEDGFVLSIFRMLADKVSG